MIDEAAIARFVAELLQLLFTAHQKGELASDLRVRQQGVAGLLGKCLEVAHGAGIGGDDLEDLACFHVGQGLFRLQDRQWAVQTARIKFFLVFHDFAVESGIAHRLLCRVGFITHKPQYTPN